MFTGVVLTESPDVLAVKGKYAKIPFIIGDQEDEGTLFSLVQYNISTTADLVNYLKTFFFYDATVEQVQGLVDTYSTNPADGSPYNTGQLNQIYPQYKRLASLLGDLVFTLTRRLFLNNTSTVFPGLPTWSYLASYDYGTPILGTFHASDILTTYGITPTFASMSIQKYYISFINTMDPNNGTTGLPAWPQWSKGNQLLQFSALSNGLIKDDFRSNSYNYIAQQATSFHI